MVVGQEFENHNWFNGKMKQMVPNNMGMRISSHSAMVEKFKQIYWNNESNYNKEQRRHKGEQAYIVFFSLKLSIWENSGSEK